jgi:uncharacterized membrane protein
MNPSQVHLALNHAPLFFSISGGIILLYGMIKKNEHIQRLSFFFLVAGALLTIPVFLTGEGTEEMVEKLPGVSENLIEEHEEMAKIALGIILATGAGALLSLFFHKNPAMNRFFLWSCLLLSLASFGAMSQTAHLGGQIRHTEIRTGAEASSKENEKEEDDKEDKNAAATVTNGTDSTKAQKKDIKKEDDD